MLKPVFALCALALCAAPSTAVERGPVYAGSPPVRFQGDNYAMTFFVSDVGAVCGRTAGHTVYACYSPPRDGRPGVMVLPNPCLFRGEWLAHVACHELGHANSWGANHEE